MFSLRLKQLRENKGLSQQALANKLGLSQSAIGMWESGKREPNFETTQKLAFYFNVSVDYLLGSVEDASKSTQEKSTKNGGLEENLVVYCRNGKTKELKLSAEKMKLFEKMLDAIKDEDVDL